MIHLQKTLQSFQSIITKVKKNIFSLRDDIYNFKTNYEKEKNESKINMTELDTKI
jgi:hypothetical protein